ncbi:MAG TPA: hypothetical protein VJO33_03420 [Gemmatimonadaceae bacterium]|nr:hypothetical protein [Gemmatimonadaceae bacterium]
MLMPMEQEEADEERVSDEDWAAIRAAVPSFADAWRAITQDSTYDGTLPFVAIHELARHVVEKTLREHPEEIERLADTLEYEFTVAALNDREGYAGLLRVGLLEGLIEAADAVGLPLTRLVPLLRGTRTREQWYSAVAYKRPGRIWNDRVGAVPTFDLPSPVGTIEIHRGRRLDDRRFLLDARLVSGDLSRARFIRREAGKDFWIERRILNISRRSSDLPDELALQVESERHEGVDEWTYLLPPMDEPFWQLADGSSWPAREPPSGEL